MADDPRGHESKPVEPIAIIGMSCRLPGTATDPPALWNMLVEGRTAWTPVSDRRFHMDGFRDPSGTKANTTNTGGGHFLQEDIAGFDAEFFGIAPVEATAMDPQQRLLLEIAYEAFENAGISLEAAWGSSTGVYVGQWASDYHEIQTRDIQRPPKYLVTGTGPAIASNRISYFFNLRGPSFTIDTGCSSSMVALHQAVQSLRGGETTHCFVGGVNLLLDPQRFTYQSKLQFFSPDGRSFAFDERANGYGRGEGCTGLVLKPLSAALQDGDPVRAVIRNSAVNQDGRTPGISVPSKEAQRKAILKAYREAKLDLHADYVEAHGTGTRVGDPIEVGAIASTLSQKQKHAGPVPIGSVKGNIGHTESAAGLAGLVKAVLMLEHGIVPSQANFERLNPAIDVKASNLRIPLTAEEVPLHRISVNSFGYGGTNAHVIIERPDPIQAPLPAQLRDSRSTVDQQSPDPIDRVFIISAAAEKSCQSACQRLAKYLTSKYRQNYHDSNSLLARLASTLQRRSVHAYRVAIVASTLEGLVMQLIAAAQSPVPAGEKRPQPRFGFVFSGQGAQYARMALELIENYPSFDSVLDRAQQQLTRLECPWNLITELSRKKEHSRINDPALSQPLSTIVQLGLIEILREMGIQPSAVVGHSSGEIAAAYAANALSLDDAITVAYFRGQMTSNLISENLHPGAMLAVGTTAEVAHGYIQSLGTEIGRLRIGCYNSPKSVTASGDQLAVERLKEMLDANGIFNRKLITNGAAYHSHQMELLRDKYASALKGITPGSVGSDVRMFSTVTDRELDSRTDLSAEYWAQNLTSPVMFTSALRRMAEGDYGGSSINTLIEVGPHSQLQGPVKQTLESLNGAGDKIAYANTLSRNNDAARSLLQLLGSLYIQHGRNPSSGQDRGCSALTPLIDLPPYSFDHDGKYWHESRLSRNYRSQKHLPHELLGSITPGIDGVEPRWSRYLSLKGSPWLQSHVVQGQVVFPAAGYISMAVEAIRQHTQSRHGSPDARRIVLRDLSFGRALVLQEDAEDLEICTSLRPQPQSASRSSTRWHEFRVFTIAADQEWTEHCRGAILAETEATEAQDPPALGADGIPRNHFAAGRSTKPHSFYRIGHECGLDWRTPFDNLTSIQTSGSSSLVMMQAPQMDAHPGGLGDPLSPCILDSALFHGVYAQRFLEDGIRATLVPTFIKNLRIANKEIHGGSNLHALSTKGSAGECNVSVGDENNDMVLEAEGVRLTSLPGPLSASQPVEEMCHALDWVLDMGMLTPEGYHASLDPVIPTSSFSKMNYSLEALSLRHIQQALTGVTLSDIPDGHLRKYFAWMQTCTGMERLDASPEKKAIDGSIPLDLGPFGKAIDRLGPELPGILTSSKDPLSLLTAGDLLSQLYSEPSWLRCYAQMSVYCRQMSRQNSGLRVLEIGAGTASATFPILTAMRDGNDRSVDQYDFTDISPGFFEAARDRLAEFQDVVTFRTLNIERDVQEQGFNEASYDLIIASNVIHATSSIEHTLQNVRRLLKPGGQFMLMEITRPTLHYNIIFGTLPGWWAGHSEGRLLSPLLTVPAWICQLERAGLAKAQEWFKDFPEEDGGLMSVFVSHSPRPPSSNGSFSSLQLVTAPSAQPFPGGSIRSIQSQLQGTEVSVNSLQNATQADLIILLPEVAQLLCHKPSAESWGRFKHILIHARAVLFVSVTGDGTLNGLKSSIWAGFSRTIRLEHPELRTVALELSVSSLQEVPTKLGNLVPKLLRAEAFNLERPGLEVDNQYLEQDGQLYVPRAFHRPEMTQYTHRNRQQAEPEMTPFLDTGRQLVAELGIPGQLESFRWRDAVKTPKVGPDEIRLEVRAAGINVRDVLVATGQMNGVPEMQNDCSGVVIDVGESMKSRFRPGDHVCVLHSQSFTNYAVVHGDYCHVVPDQVSFAEAASLPTVWATVYYSLVEKARLAKGEKILIHSAAGAVGQAAITLAQYLGAEVFATAGSAANRQFLLEKYYLGDDHVFSSQSRNFAGGVKRITEGYGVDVVLNSLSGDAFCETTTLVAPFGRLVEIGWKQSTEDALMPMGFLHRNVTFAYVDLGMIIAHDRLLSRQLLASGVTFATTHGNQPVSMTTMPMSQIDQAFRLLQQGEHVGKVVLTVEEDQEVKAIPPVPEQARFRSDATYLVVGGFGGVGRAIISWMADHGAEVILCLSRSGIANPQGQKLIDEFSARGVTIIAKACDISSGPDVATLALQVTRDRLPPVRGIFHCGMALQDTLFGEMDHEDWHTALAPKVDGTIHLYETWGQHVDFFINLSSILALMGNASQCNYAAACGFQDALAHRHAELGVSAYSINVGIVAETGYVSENPEVAALIRRQGFRLISIADVLALLNYAVTHPDATDRVWSLGLVPAEDTKQVRGLQERCFSHLGPRRHSNKQASTASADALTLLEGVRWTEDVVQIISQAILQRLARLIATSVDRLSPAKSLDNYGVDSLVAVELHNWIAASLQANISLAILRGASSIHDLAQIVSKASSLVREDGATAA
ncbi:polyketide synthase [Aspergillus steynii IBT 23096]|uniref:Polyketide synthase n=1 Tax=Aspergillus steynii IBT 23096 TaxID=1392250 RepID=A0A2I2G821_9EURO|nr:polyketide synthase [Aspergillus steynii IBT 23096]PLB49030.1 polyketide synthase [Aspergillus steynii IBT 23096]